MPWHNVATSRVIVDHRGWFKRLQLLAGSHYPDRLVHSIGAFNAPMVRGGPASFLAQLETAAERDDAIASNHRCAAFLASYFDLLFAANRQLHPGEKRLATTFDRADMVVPQRARDDILDLLTAVPWLRVAIAGRLADGILGLDTLAFADR